MANTIITWLIGILFVIFAVLMFIAGFGLVTSAGNVSAKEAAKSKFSNALIGIIIVFAAWLIVDTIIRGLVMGDGKDGESSGEIKGYGPWSEIECYEQSKPVTIKLSDLELEDENNPSGNTGSGTPVPPNIPGMVSLRAAGVNVANWNGINGPGRTDLAHPTAVAAAKAMQDAGRARFGVTPFQVTAAYTEGVGHSANSKHYQGIAIDFQPINGVTKEQVAALAREFGFTYVLIEARHVHADMR